MLLTLASEFLFLLFLWFDLQNGFYVVLPARKLQNKLAEPFSSVTVRNHQAKVHSQGLGGNLYFLTGQTDV